VGLTAAAIFFRFYYRVSVDWSGDQRGFSPGQNATVLFSSALSFVPRWRIYPGLAGSGVGAESVWAAKIYGARICMNQVWFDLRGYAVILAWVLAIWNPSTEF
jgi:hypothetical protein